MAEITAKEEFFQECPRKMKPVTIVEKKAILKETAQN